MSIRRSRANSSDNPDEDNVRKKERLDSAIYKLKERKGGFSEDDDSKSNNSVSSASSKPNSKGDKVNILETFNEADFRIIPKTDALNLTYTMWENTSNVCWLDASMALLAHNQTLRYECDLSGSTHVKKIIKYYNEAISLLNDDSSDWSIEQRLEISKMFLSTVQDTSLQYLQPILKYNNGDPESAFCSLLNLIREDKSVGKYFEVKYLKSFLCEKCGKNRATTINKPIITLPKVVAFQPSSPCFVSECPSCKDQEQRIQVLYKNLPKCLFFHFENGAGKGELCPLDFTISGREYKVTGLMTLEKSEETAIDHFVTWIRDPSSDFWLECNDLNPEVLKFAAIPPNCIRLEDVCMIMYESFDDLGILEIKTDESESAEKLNIEDEEADDDNIPFIDLSQDNEEHNRSNRGTPRKMQNDSARNMPLWNDGDDLKFLNSICGSPSNSPKTNSDPQPDSFMKQLDLKPKTDESQRNFIMTPENHMLSEDACFSSKGEQNNISLQGSLSPKYTDLIKKLAAQNDDPEDIEALSPSDLNQTLESMKQNILSDAAVKSPLKPSPSSAEEEIVSDKKRSDSACSSKHNRESQPTKLKLVASTNSQNRKENDQSSSTELIESEFLIEQHDKINHILAARKGAHSKIKFSSHDKNKCGSRHPSQKVDLLDKEDESNTADISSHILDSDETNEKENETKGSDLDKVDNEALSVVPGEIHERPPFPIEVKTTIIDSNVLSESKYSDSKHAFFKSMPVFPVEVETQMSTLEGQEKDECNYSVSPISTSSNGNKHKSEAKERCKLSGDSSPLQFSDFLNRENSYNEMALIVKESEEITPENIIKVIRNVKPLTSSKSSNSPVSVSAKDKKRKRKMQGKDVNLKIKSFTINVARLTPQEILQYSPGTVLGDLSVGSARDSTSTNRNSLTCNASNAVYQENFDDILKPESSKQQQVTNLQKKKGKVQELNTDKPSCGVRKSKRQGTENKLTVKTIKNTSTANKRGRPRRQITSSEVVNQVPENISIPPVQQPFTENISSPEKIKLETISVTPTKTRGRKKKFPNTKRAIESMNGLVQDHDAEDISEALIKNQPTLKNDKLLGEKMPPCEVGKKWGKKEKQPAFEEPKLISDIKGNESNGASSVGNQKRKRPKNDADMSDEKNLNLLEEINLPVRKSNRKRADAFATLKDNYILESTDSKSNIPFIGNQESMSVIIKQEKDVSQFNLSSTIDADENSGLDEEILKSQKNPRKRNYNVSSASDSDLNTKSETSIEQVGPVSLSKKSKNATSSCTSASEAELINAGDVKSGRRKKRKLSNIKSEDTLSIISQKLTETKSNVLKVASPSPVKEQLNQNRPVEHDVTSPMHIERKQDKGTNKLSSQREIKIESVPPMQTKSQLAKMLPNATKRGSRKKSVDLISGTVPSTHESSKKSESSLSPMRTHDLILQDGTNVIVDVLGRKIETTPRKKKDSRQGLSPKNSNRVDVKSVQKLIPDSKDSDHLDLAVDCIVDLYLTKAYNLFGIGWEEIGH